MSFNIGDRIRINWWTDRRESGFQYGTVKGKPVDCFGIITQVIQWDAGYESLAVVSMFEGVGR